MFAAVKPSSAPSLSPRWPAALLFVSCLASCGSSDDTPVSGGPNAGAPIASAGASATGTGGGLASAGAGMGGTALGVGGSPAMGGGGATTGGQAGGSGGSSTSQGGAAGASGAGGTGGSASTTCTGAALPPGDSNRTLQVGGVSREYVLHVPTAYDGKKPVPLILDFHPLGGSGPSERTGSPYPAQTDAEGVIMAFPSGKSGPSGGAWNVGACCVAGVDDVAFAKALVAEIQKATCIDPKRVYAVGFSMGGGMSHYLACHGADVFAAVAPAAFDLLQENVDDCKPARPLTVVAFRGTTDPIVPYAGGYSAVVSGMPINFLGAKATFEKWGQLNQCSGAASAEDAQGCSKFSTCKDGVEVALCTKQGGGHEAGNAKVAWPILKQHQLP
jgi:polyhydroxybutyrate depolymerase